MIKMRTGNNETESRKTKKRITQKLALQKSISLTYLEKQINFLKKHTDIQSSPLMDKWILQATS